MVLRLYIFFFEDIAFKLVLITSPIFEFRVGNLFLFVSLMSSNSWYFCDFLIKSFN